MRLQRCQTCLQLPRLDPLPLYNSLEPPFLPFQVHTRLTSFKLSEGFMCGTSSCCKSCVFLTSENAQ